MKNKRGKIEAVVVLGLAGILCIALLTAGAACLLFACGVKQKRSES